MLTPCPVVSSAVSPASTISPEATWHAEHLGSPLDRSQKEEARLRALHSLCILDTPPEPEFDDCAQLASAICGTPVSLISFVDEHRQWFKSSHGLDLAETPRSISFCHHAIQEPGMLLVEDTRLDPRFQTNPLVTGSAGWRFYAGVPLDGAEGHALGTLCVLDRVPRSLTPEQKASLHILAHQVNTRLKLRTQRRELERALQRAEVDKQRAEAVEQRFRTFMDSGPFLAYMKDEDGRMLYYNQPMATQFHVSAEDLLNKTDAELWPAELAATYRKHDLEVFRSGRLQMSDEHTYNPDGSTSVWRSFKFPCPGSTGQTLLGGISVDVTLQLQRQEEVERYQAELEAANRRLRELASVDALTGLANRRVFDEELRITFRRARQDAAPLSLLLLDVDRFKVHNDRFGHAHGDDVLRELARCLGAHLRSGDLVARYGGEEFVVLLPDTPPAEAHVLAERLLDAVRRQPWTLAPVTVSIGLSTLNPATRDTRHLVGRADEALYAAKCSGRDRVIAYTDELNLFAYPLQPS